MTKETIQKWLFLAYIILAILTAFFGLCTIADGGWNVLWGVPTLIVGGIGAFYGTCGFIAWKNSAPSK